MRIRGYGREREKLRKIDGIRRYGREKEGRAKEDR